MMAAIGVILCVVIFLPVLLMSKRAPRSSSCSVAISRI